MIEQCKKCSWIWQNGVALELYCLFRQIFLCDLCKLNMRKSKKGRVRANMDKNICRNNREDAIDAIGYGARDIMFFSPVVFFVVEYLEGLYERRHLQLFVETGLSLPLIESIYLEKRPLQLTASLWKLFEILSYEILEVKFKFSIKTFISM